MEERRLDLGLHGLGIPDRGTDIQSIDLVVIAARNGPQCFATQDKV